MSCWCSVLLNINNTFYARPCHFRNGLIKCCLVSCVSSTRKMCVRSALFDSNERPFNPLSFFPPKLALLGREAGSSEYL